MMQGYVGRFWGWWRDGHEAFWAYNLVLAGLWGWVAYCGHVREEHVLLVWGAVACFHRIGVGLKAGAE